MDSPKIVVIGAGIGGLVSALLLAARGLDVTVVERQATPGGKLRQHDIGGKLIDAGPTVFTMRWVFEEIFAQADAQLQDHLQLTPSHVLARHAWSERERLDLYADLDQTVDAISAFSSPDEGRRYKAFCEDAQGIFETLNGPFIEGSRTNTAGLIRRMGLTGLPKLFSIKPFSTLWSGLGRHFRDPRLQQLFGRYATYSGSSPFASPATLMLIAHVERKGVWLVEGGMHQIAHAVATLAADRGVKFRYQATVKSVLMRHGRPAGVAFTTGEVIEASHVVVNSDVSALGSGRFGNEAQVAARETPPRDRSLSAMTWAMVAETGGFPMARHNVFFSRDYKAEFDDLFRYRRFPAEPTVYICAEDRGGANEPVACASERLFFIANAPAIGDSHVYDTTEIEQCRTRTIQTLARCGLEIRSTPESTIATTPTDFEDLYPATGGALYGRATHGSQGSFKREGARSRVPGMYLAGGSVHPGAGVPMAALSGRQAAMSLLTDLASTGRSPRAAMRGGTSTR